MKGSPRFHFALPFRRGVPGASFPEPPFCFFNPCRSRCIRGKSGEARRVSAGLPVSRPLFLYVHQMFHLRAGRGGFFFFRSQKSEVGRQNGKDRSRNGEAGSQKSEGRSQEVQMSNCQIVHKSEAKSQEVQMSNRQIVHKSEVGMRLATRRGATTLNPVQAKRSSGEPKCQIVKLSKSQNVQLSNSSKSQDI